MKNMITSKSEDEDAMTRRAAAAKYVRGQSSAASPPTIALQPTAGQAASCIALQTLLLDCNVLQRTLLCFILL